MTKKKLIYVVLGILVSALMAVTFGGQRADAKKLKTEKYTGVYVACGKTYSISKIAREKKGETGFTLAEDIKGKKVTWSSSHKNLVVKKKTFRVKKPGSYRLIGKRKNQKFVLPVYATNKYRNEDYSRVAYVQIRSGSTGEDVTVENIEEVGAVCESIQQSKFTFDYEESQKIRVGWSYYIKLYSADNVLIDSLTVGATYDSRFCFRCQYPEGLRNYVEQLFNKYNVKTMP